MKDSKKLNNRMMVYRVSEDLYYRIKKYQEISNIELSPLIRDFIITTVLEEFKNESNI